MREVKNICDCKDCVIRNLVFAHLKDAEFENVCTLKLEKDYRKGEIIYEKGQYTEHLVYLKKGMVKYYQSFHDNRNSIITLSIPHDIFALITIFQPESVHQFSMSAVEDSTVCFIPIKIIKDIILENGNFSLDLIQKNNQAAQQIINHFLLLNSKNLRGRVAHVLLHLATHIYHKDIFELPVSRKEIAELIGMTTENVIRTLSEFRKEKIIRINGKEIEIVEKERLHKISLYG